MQAIAQLIAVSAAKLDTEYGPSDDVCDSSAAAGNPDARLRSVLRHTSSVPRRIDDAENMKQSLSRIPATLKYSSMENRLPASFPLRFVQVNET